MLYYIGEYLRRGSNPQSFRHSGLNRMCIPIPPRKLGEVKVPQPHIFQFCRLQYVFTISCTLIKLLVKEFDALEYLLTTSSVGVPRIERGSVSRTHALPLDETPKVAVYTIPPNVEGKNFEITIYRVAISSRGVLLRTRICLPEGLFYIKLHL